MSDETGKMTEVRRAGWRFTDSFGELWAAVEASLDVYLKTLESHVDGRLRDLEMLKQQQAENLVSAPLPPCDHEPHWAWKAAPEKTTWCVHCKRTIRFRWEEV